MKPPRRFSMLRLSSLMVTLLVSATACGAEVQITREADGTFSAIAPQYQARIGSDGNLHSLSSGGVEFLSDGYRGLVGGGFQTLKEGEGWAAKAVAFAEVRPEGPDAIVATLDRRKLTYRFLPDSIELAFDNPVEYAPWSLAINPAVQDIWETGAGERLVPKVAYREGTMQLFATSGTNITLPTGSVFYSARNSQTKLDSDPFISQIWIARTGPGAPVRHRIAIHDKPTLADSLQVKTSAGPGNHILVDSGPLDVSVECHLRFPQATVAGELELAVREELTGKAVARQKQSFSLSDQGTSKARFTLPLAPGFYDVDVAVKQGNELLNARHFPFVCGLKTLAAPSRPDDFDQFWNDTLREQDRIPPNVQLVLHQDEPTHQLFKMRFDGLLGRQFHAWLSVPKTPGKHLAQLTLPPSRVNPPYLPASGPNVVGMSLAIAGQEVLPPEGGYKHWDYWRSGIETRETWYYRSVFAACSRAIDLLAARPDVDPQKIFVQGGSQGGGLSFITAALNPKVGMAVCSSPGLFDLEAKLRSRGPKWWPPIDVLNAQGQPAIPPDADALEARIKVARYGDAANFASRIRCPVLLNLGLQDIVTSPVGALACWSRLDGTRYKGLLADPWGGHNGPRGGQRAMSHWLQALDAGNLNLVKDLPAVEGLPILIEVQPGNASPPAPR